MTISFDVRRNAPLGSAPEIEGDASNAFALATEATVGWSIRLSVFGAQPTTA